MRYQTTIGWRYLFRSHDERPMVLAILFGVFLVVDIAMGLRLFAFEHSGAVPVSVATFTISVLATVLFGLLYAFSVFTTVSIYGVVLGVSALTVVLAVMTGFEQQFRVKVLGVNAHVLITRPNGEFDDYRDIEDLARTIDDEVLAVEPFVFLEMLATRGKGEVSGVGIKGIDPSRVHTVLDLHKYMEAGDVTDLAATAGEGAPPPVIVGRGLADKLHASVGDTVTIVALSADELRSWVRGGATTKTRVFRITGVFYSGFDEYDRRLMFMNIRDSQELLGRGDIVTGVELKVKDVSRASAIARKLERAVDDPLFVVQDWRQLNDNLFTALSLQKFVVVVVLGAVIAVAAFNLVSALMMMVTDKTPQIAILKSMGATSGGVASVFQVVGLLVGGVGTVFGLGIGLTVCNLLADYGYHLDPKVYLIDQLPVVIRTHEVLLVAAVTMVIAAVATLIPARRAARLSPVDGLRYEKT